MSQLPVVAVTELVNPTDLISPSITITSRRRAMMSAAMSLLKRAGKTLMDADWDPWSSGIPAHTGSAWDQFPAEVREDQLVFTATLQIVREIARRAPSGSVVYTHHQDSSVPTDGILLNLWFYLTAEGFDLGIKVSREKEGGFSITLMTH